MDTLDRGKNCRTSWAVCSLPDTPSRIRVYTSCLVKASVKVSIPTEITYRSYGRNPRFFESVESTLDTSLPEFERHSLRLCFVVARVCGIRRTQCMSDLHARVRYGWDKICSCKPDIWRLDGFLGYRCVLVLIYMSAKDSIENWAYHRVWTKGPDGRNYAGETSAVNFSQWSLNTDRSKTAGEEAKSVGISPFSIVPSQFSQHLMFSHWPSATRLSIQATTQALHVVLLWKHVLVSLARNCCSGFALSQVEHVRRMPQARLSSAKHINWMDFIVVLEATAWRTRTTSVDTVK